MKIYFNANNKAHQEALEQCGVKNVMLSFRYSYANIAKFRKKFDKIFVTAGTGTIPEKYYEFLHTKLELYDYATQFDVRYNTKDTMYYYNRERLKENIDWTIPVLQENYLNHLAFLRPDPNDYVALGEIHGKIETEDQIRKLPMNIKYHGLAKGKHVTQTNLFESLDTSAWISAAMSKKTEVWNANSTYSMFFGNKGKTMKPMLNHALEVYKENLEKVGITKTGVIEDEYYSLLKAPIALLFMPMCKSLRIYEENFNK